MFSMLLCQFGINLLRCHVSLCATNHVLSCMHTHVVLSLMHYIFPMQCLRGVSPGTAALIWCRIDGSSGDAGEWI